MKEFLAYPVLLTLLFGTPAFADYQKGLDAASRGDFATAFKEWKPLADQGDANAQDNLGRMYVLGLSVTKDYKTAFKWFQLAADQGLAEAQFNLGFMYSNGNGVTRDYKAALKWYKLAAEQGHTGSQFNLGR